jgi:hypothetical protein
MTDLHEADANDDLRQPIGDLFQVGIALVLRNPFRPSGPLHRARDPKQEPDNPAR